MCGDGVLTAQEIDDLCAFALERLTGRGADPHRAMADLVAHLARTRPEAPALSPILPLALAASALESVLNGDESRQAAQGTWRIAALLAAEVLAIQADGAVAPSVVDLHARLAGG